MEQKCCISTEFKNECYSVQARVNRLYRDQKCYLPLRASDCSIAKNEYEYSSHENNKGLKLFSQTI